MGAALAPGGTALFDADVVQGAGLLADAAAGAGLAGVELIRRHGHGVEQGVDEIALDGAAQAVAQSGQGTAVLDALSYLVQQTVGPADYGLSRLPGGDAEHGHVIFGHGYLGQAPELQSQVLRHPPQAAFRPAAAAAAGQHRVQAVIPFHGGLAQVFLHHPGQAPGVGGRHQDEGGAGDQGLIVVVFDAAVQVHQLAADHGMQAQCGVAAVAGAAEIHDHGASPYWKYPVEISLIINFIP